MTQQATTGWHNVVGATPNELRRAEIESLVRYGDIIDLPAPVSRRHPRQPADVRAAQFAPFAALVGYGDEVRETARLTEERRELEEDEKREIDEALREIARLLASRAPVTVRVRYFVPDARKAGGSYVEATGAARRIDAYRRTLALTDGTMIPIADIVHVDVEGGLRSDDAGA